MERENPVRVARRDLGLSRRELALAAGTSYEETAKLELGYSTRLNCKVAAWLATKGYRDAVVDYERWRAEAAKAVGAAE